MSEESAFHKFKELVDKEIDKHGLKDEEHLLDNIPKQDNRKHGAMEVVKLNGLAMTSEGMITRHSFFENLEIDKEQYGEIELTANEARSLMMNYRKLTTGVNSAVPMTCTWDKCPFKEECWYYQNDKVLLGKPCKVEYDLLNFHTVKFIEEFDVKTEDHSEVMLVQELAELIVYEMRASRALAGDDASRMMGHKIKFSPDGDEIEEETIHWAWDLKEKIKNRRMKILDALMATRKNKAKTKDEKGEEDSYTDNVKSIVEKIRQSQHGIHKDDIQDAEVIV